MIGMNNRFGNKMSKQPEQILEDNLIKQLQTLGMIITEGIKNTNYEL